MSLETNDFEFGEFLLDTKEKVLFREGKPVPVTPKTFQLLSALVENHGRLVEKEELMKMVWADSFVEAGNLSFTMRLLRKALGDDTQNPRFIETVPRRGYRFIAEVRVAAKENASHNDLPAPLARPVEEKPRPPGSGFDKALLPVFALLFAAVILIGFWFFKSKNFSSVAPVLDAPFSSENLSTNGKVPLAVLSPDGKNVIYTNGMSGDKQSVWLRQLETGSNVEIIPPSDEQYFGLALSPDEKTLYFARRSRSFREPTDIYRVSIFGGVPEKIVTGTELGWMGISPDGKQISYVRCPQQSDEFCSLNVADSADGKNERKILSRPYPFRIGANRFAPDGKSIAFAAGTSVGSSNEFELWEVELDGGERNLTDQKFFDIKNLAWLPDKSGLLITASRFPNKNFRIWQVSAGSGDASPLTKDSESYAVLNMNKEASAIVSTRFKEDFRIKLIPLENPSQTTTLTNASAASFAPDGRIYFSSIISGNDEIWSINADGSGQRQLTNNAADEFAPFISPDNKTVFFVSNKSGSAQLWRMNTDGSNQTQITETDGGAPVFVSPDGEWVYYRHILTSVLWRISTKSGERQLVLNKEKPRFAFSPDGSRVAFSEKQGDERILTVVSLPDGQTVKTFRLADRKLILMHIVWMPDGKNLAYITAAPGFVNKVLWLHPLDKETPRQIRVLGDEEITEGYGLAVSPDGKSFALVQGGWRHDAVLLKGLR
jgi:Tol biopolymer transport system component/DNA-binding winged helix-turn-helix (wHTH) protein